MTDNEIIRLLGHIVTLYAKDATTIYGKPVVALLGDALDLINRQNAEIERLLKAINDKHCVYEKRVVSEALKEFAERLEQNKILVDVSNGYGRETFTEAVTMIEIFHQMKEMVGDTE